MRDSSPPSIQGIYLFINGEMLSGNSSPALINNRTMVPLRVVFEKLGFDFQYNPATQTVNAVNGSIVIRHKIGTAYMEVNGNPIYFDTPSTVINGRTLIPVRMVIEAIGGNICIASGQVDGTMVVAVNQY